MANTNKQATANKPTDNANDATLLPMLDGSTRFPKSAAFNGTVTIGDDGVARFSDDAHLTASFTVSPHGKKP